MEYPTAETPRVGVTRFIPVQLGSGSEIHAATAIWAQPWPPIKGRWTHSGRAFCDRASRYVPTNVVDRPRSQVTCSKCLAVIALSTVFVASTADPSDD